MKSTAPPNSGFTPAATGWVRLWLAGDATTSSGRDLWAVVGGFYPLEVAAYDLSAEPSAGKLTFDESQQLGGYRHSLGLDEPPYANLPTNVGCYNGLVSFPLVVRLKARGDADFTQVTLESGDFFAQDVEAVEAVEGSSSLYLFLVMA